MLPAGVVWLPSDTWTVVVAAFCSISCALLGCFLLLRRMSMMGDAISHAVLPGLATAFLLTGSRGSGAMLVGAVIAGVLTALMTEWIRRAGRVDESASMGVVFTILFAVGLILIRRAADQVDLDPDCVLYGSIELVVLDTIRLFGLDVPRAAISTAIILLLNASIVALLFKEFKITSFDPALATTLGINATLMHYLLMVLVAVTTVAAFESVGSILVIAMLIVPAAAAHLLCDRLSLMLLIASAIASASALLGHVGAIAAPSWLGYPGVSTSTSGMISVAVGLLFLLALLASPRHGLLSKALHQALLALRIAREDALGLLYRRAESAEPHAPRGVRHAALRHAAAPRRGLLMRVALWQLRRAGQVERHEDLIQLTPAGYASAQQLIRSHRLWETYFEQNAALPPGHSHAPAERLEHITSPILADQLSRAVGAAKVDPQGKPIPAAPPTE